MTRVMLFEPDEDVRLVAAIALREAGYDVVAASTEGEVRSAIAAGDISGAIVEAGEMSDPEWSVFAEARLHGVSVVVCTVHANDPEVVERARSARALLLEKTGDPTDLLRAAELALTPSP